MRRFFQWSALWALAAIAVLNCSSDDQNLLPPQETVEISSIVILPLPVRDRSPIEQETIWTLLAETFHRRYGVQVLAGRSVGRAVWGRLDNGAQESCSAFEANVQEGRRAFTNLQINRTLQLMDQARNQLRLCDGEGLKPSSVIDFFVYYGMALLSHNQVQEADAVFRKAVAINSELVLSAKNFRSDQLAEFEKAKRQLLSGKPTPVQIRSRRAGAAIFVDGRPMGVTPSKEILLYPGYHLIRLEFVGHAPWMQPVLDNLPPPEVTGQMVPLLTGEPPEELLELASEGQSLSKKAKEELKRVAEIYEVEAVLIVSLENTGKQIRSVVRFFIPTPKGVFEVKPIELSLKPGEYEREADRGVQTFREFFKKKPPTAAQKK
jgi:hypothetical protein